MYTVKFGVHGLLATVLVIASFAAAGLTGPSPAVAAAEGVSAPGPEPSSPGRPGPDGDGGSGWIRDVDASWEEYNFFTGNDLEQEFYPDMATNSAGVVYAVFEVYDDENDDFGIGLMVSYDGGVTWQGSFSFFFSNPFIVADDALWDERDPSIAIDPFNDTVYVAYERWETPTASSIAVSWGFPADLTTWYSATVYQQGCPFGCFWAESPVISMESRVSSSYYYIALESYWNFVTTSTVVVYGSTDGGGFWTQIYTTPVAGDYRQPDLVINYGPGDSCDKRGYLVYRYGLDETQPYEIRFESITGTCGSLLNGGVAGPWPVLRVLYNGTVDGIFPNHPSMAASYGGGTLAVAWQYDRTIVDPTFGFDIGLSTSPDEGNNWYYSTALHSDLGSEYVPNVAVDGEGSTIDVLGSYHIAYLRDPASGGNDAVLYHSMPYDFSAGPTPEVRVSDDAAALSYSYMSGSLTTQLRPDGLWYPVVSWTDYRAGTTDYNIYATTPGGNLTVGTSPEGLWYGVNGNAYNVRTNWSVAAGYPIDVNTSDPQYAAPDMRHVYTGWTDLGGFSHSFNMTPADLNVTAIFVAEYQVIIDTNPSPDQVIVDTTPYVTPATFWWRAGESHNVEAYPYIYVAADIRVNWTDWSDGGTMNHDILILGPGTLVANYGTTEYLVTVDTTPSGYPVDVDYVTYTSPVGFWWTASSNHNVTATQYLQVAPDQRLNFTAWSDGGWIGHDFTVVGPDILRAAYGGAEYLVNVDTNPSVGFTLNVDAQPYVAPQPFWWADGSLHDLDAPTYQNTAPGVRGVFQSWSDGGAQQHSVTATAPYNHTANYGWEYQVNVGTSPAGLEVFIDDIPYTTVQSPWWPLLSLHYINATPAQPAGPGSRYSFFQWLGGIVPSTPANVNLIVTGPGDVTAEFVRQYQVTIDTQPTGLDVLVDGVLYTAPQTFWWDEGSSHSVLAYNTQGVLYFAQWVEDSSPVNSRSIVVSTSETYTANYTSTPPAFAATASGNPTAGVAPLLVAFTASASGGTAPYSWDWDFGDGVGTSSAQNPSYSYNNPGTYDVIVVIADSASGSRTVAIPITVTAAPLVLDSCTVTPASATVSVGLTQAFTAHGWNGSVEIPSGLTTTWGTTGGIGSISGAGVFTAGAAAGLGTVTANVTDGTITVVCAVPVQVITGAAPTVLIISPLQNAQVTATGVLVVGTSTNADRVEVRADGGAWVAATGVPGWSLTLSLVGLSNGPVLIEARAFNATIESTWDFVTIQLAVPANAPPVADAGPAQSGFLKGILVTLDGAGSSDSDGDPLTYAWVQTSGPAVTLSGASTVGPTFTPSQSGTYGFRLTVDDGGATDTDTVSITVTNRDPTIDTTNPSGQTASGQTGAGTPLSVTASDPDGDALIYRWSVDGSPQNGSATSAFTFTPVAVGSYTVVVTVTDPEGAIDTHSWVVTVTQAGTVSDFPLWIVGLILAIVALLIIFLLVFMRRRKQEPEGAAPPGMMPPGEAAPPQEPSMMPTEGAPAAPAAEPAPAPAAEPAGDDVSARIARLKNLRDQGLMTQQEYEARRKELLDKL